MLCRKRENSDGYKKQKKDFTEKEEFELDLGGWLEYKWKEKRWEDTNDKGNLSTGGERVRNS